MTRILNTKVIVEIAPPSGLAQSTTHFGLTANIFGSTYEFNFNWNGKYQYYTMRVIGPSGHVAKHRMLVEDARDIFAFLGDGLAFRDARLIVADSSGGDLPLRPSNFGKTHTLLVIIGQLSDEAVSE